MNSDSFLKRNNHEVIRNLEREISQFVVGYYENTLDILNCILSGGHALIEGVPGIAKTTLSRTLANTLGLKYRRIQCTQDILPADIIGHYYFDLEKKKFEPRKGPIFTEILLVDEINRAPPKTQSALLEAMEERKVTIEGNTFDLPEIFFVIATLNPIETEGVYPLPEAQIDRFIMKITMDYPSDNEEIEILKLNWRDNGQPREILDKETILQMRGEVREVFVHPSILIYIKNIARTTRDIDNIELGLSPRGSIHLLLSAKSRAYLFRRSYVIPDDVKGVAHQVINHRLILSPEAELQDISAASITNSILSELEIPREDFQSRASPEA